MQITVRLPNNLGENVKRRTDNASEHLTDALAEKIQREERRRARRERLDMAGVGSVDPDVHEQNQQLRRAKGRSGDLSFE